MNGNRPGKPPKPPLKAPNGDIQLGVADFFKPSNQTAREKKTAEREAAKAHAERVAGDRAAEAERDAATAEKKRMPGRPPKLASGISSRGAGPLWGRTPSIPSHAHARTRVFVQLRGSKALT